MKKYTLCFSLNVHENMDVINQQITNILKHNPSSCIVLHVSNRMKDFVNPNHPDVYVNPLRHPSSHDKLWHCVMSNFLFIDQVVIFDYFILDTSSTLFYNGGAESYIRQYKAGFEKTPILDIWSDPLSLKTDILITTLLKSMNKSYTDMIHSNHEGTFYEYDLFKYIISRLIQLPNLAIYDINSHSHKYNLLEYIFPSIASWSLPSESQGHPITQQLDKQIQSSRESIKSIIIKLVKEGKYKFAITKIPKIINNPIRNYILNINELLNENKNPPILNKQLKKRLFDIAYKHKLNNLGSCLSCIDVMNWIFENKQQNDIFISSNQRSELAHYVVLEKFFNSNAEELLKQQTTPHLDDYNNIYCSPVGSDAGIITGIGRALANSNRVVHVLIHDEDCISGNLWESLAFIDEYPVTNIKIYIIHNKYSPCYDTQFETFQERFNIFGISDEMITIIQDSHESIDALQIFNEVDPNTCVLTKEDYTTLTNTLNK